MTKYNSKTMCTMIPSNSRVDDLDERSHFLNYQDGLQRRWPAGGPYLLFYIPQFVEINTSTVSAKKTWQIESFDIRV